MININLREWLTLALLIVIAAGAAAGLVWLAVGLFRARSLIRREFSAYFLSPIAYVVLVFFLLVTGYLYAETLGLLTAKGPVGTESPMQAMFGDSKLFWLVFLFIPPLLTMRLFAEERSSGTLEMLMTAPLRDWQVVLCKYLACLAFYSVLWLPTLLYLPALLGAGFPVFRGRLPVFHNVWTLDSYLLVAGSGCALLGAAMGFLRLGRAVRLALLGLVVLGVVAACVGGVRHYYEDGPHLIEIPVANGWTAASIVFVAGLGCTLVGLAMLLPHLGTGGRLLSLALTAVGIAAAGVGGWQHYHADGPHLFEIPVLLDPYPVLWTYAGMFLAGAMLLSIGLLISSLVHSQMVAAILALAVGLVFVGGSFWRPELTGSGLYNLVYFFSVPMHFDRTFTRGLMDTRPLILYGSTALFCLFLTVRSLEARRWQ